MLLLLSSGETFTQKCLTGHKKYISPRYRFGSTANDLIAVIYIAQFRDSQIIMIMPIYYQNQLITEKSVSYEVITDKMIEIFTRI